MTSRSSRRRLLASIVVLLVVVAAGCSGGRRPVVLGVAADTIGVYDAAGAAVGAPLGLYEWYQAWEGRSDFDRARADEVVRRGALPVLTWEPWAPGAGPVQPAYALSRISAGAYDDYIRSFAAQIRNWHHVLALRFAHEANTIGYPWAVGVNGNTPADAVAAYRHVHALVEASGADVVWVWSVNVSAPGSADYRAFYPGDRLVDWVGLDGYNGGTALPWGGWKTPEQLYGHDLRTLDELAGRPLFLTEVGSAEAGGDKAEWIAQLPAVLRRHHVRGLIWFQYAKEADWRLTSSPATTEAFRRALGTRDR